MVRDLDNSGFGPARPGYLRATALVCLLLGACAREAPPPQNWGYDFAQGRFTDQRPDDDAKLTAAVPFDLQTFMQKWKANTTHSVFVNNPARLDITLTHYEATTSGWSYALSMEAKLRGRDEAGRILAEKTVSCNAVARTGARTLGGSMQQVVRKETLDPLTTEGLTGTMWQQVWDTCVKDMTVQFGEALASGS